MSFNLKKKKKKETTRYFKRIFEKQKKYTNICNCIATYALKQFRMAVCPL